MRENSEFAEQRFDCSVWRKGSKARLFLTGLRALLFATACATCSNAANATNDLIEGSFFSPQAYSGCYFSGAVYHFEGDKILFRSEGSQFVFFDNVSIKEMNGSVVVDGDPTEMPLDGKLVKHMKIVFDHDGEDLVPIAVEVDGQKREFENGFLKTFMFRKCSNQSYLGKFLLMIGWQKPYSEEQLFVSYKRNADGSYSKQ